MQTVYGKAVRMRPYPVILVPGIGQSRTRLTENGKLAWPLDVDTEKLKKILLLPAIRMVLFRHDCGFEKALRKAVREALEPLRSTQDGHLVHPVRVETFENSLAHCTPEQRHFISRMVPYSVFAEPVGEENLYYFACNPMGDAGQTVEELRAFVCRILEQTGAPKVSFVAISLGGSIITQYLERYVSCGDTARVIGIVAAFDGSRLLSGILQKNISTRGMIPIAELLLGRKAAQALEKSAGLIPHKLLHRYADAVLDCLPEVLLRSTVMWGAIPASQYPELCERFLSGEPFAALRARTQEAYRVRANLPALVEKCARYGTDIYSLYGCGRHLLAVNDDADSDGIVHTASCRRGETAQESPIAGNTRAFPGMEHEDAAKEPTLLALCAALLRGDVENIQTFDGKAALQ